MQPRGPRFAKMHPYPHPRWLTCNRKAAPTSASPPSPAPCLLGDGISRSLRGGRPAPSGHTWGPYRGGRRLKATCWPGEGRAGGGAGLLTWPQQPQTDRPCSPAPAAARPLARTGRGLRSTRRAGVAPLPGSPTCLSWEGRGEEREGREGLRPALSQLFRDLNLDSWWTDRGAEVTDAAGVRGEVPDPAPGPPVLGQRGPCGGSGMGG